MYGPLLRRRNLLLVDQRGTGRSRADRLPGPAEPQRRLRRRGRGLCGRSSATTRRPTTARAQSADDLAAVIRRSARPVDLYGDSYGTFFAQVFAGRHPDLLRSVVLDSAYPTYGEDAWYPTQTPAMRRSFDVVCARTPSCAAAGGSTIDRVAAGARRRCARNPWRTGTRHDADGKPHAGRGRRARRSSTVAFGATYGLALYRELDRRAALRRCAGDRAPLLRLVAEAYFGGGTDAARPVAYSEGLDAAVACHDYPQLYDMTATPAVRARSSTPRRSGSARAHRPGHLRAVHDPRVPRVRLGGAGLVPAVAGGRPGAPRPARRRRRAGTTPAVPTLVLSGELDSITTPAEGALVAAQFPGARQVLVANSFHVTADGDTDGCGRELVQAFVRDPTAALPASALACARSRAAGPGGSDVRAFVPGQRVGSLRTRAAQTVALTAADAMDRWWESLAGFGTGLRGGTWTSAGDHTVTLHLKGYRLTDDLAVTGDVVWGRYASTASIDLRFDQVDPAGRVRDTDHVGGQLVGRWTPDGTAPGCT